MIYRTVTVKAKIEGSVVQVTPSINGNVSANADIVSLIRSTNYDEYTGDMEFTPSQEEQTILTDHRVVMGNITINPIPNNYGLITWNGVVLTVS